MFQNEKIFKAIISKLSINHKNSFYSSWTGISVYYTFLLDKNDTLFNYIIIYILSRVNITIHNPTISPKYKKGAR